MNTRIAITPGEPAGVGPDLLISLIQAEFTVELVAIACPTLLQERAEKIGLPLKVHIFNEKQFLPSGHGNLSVIPINLAAACTPGTTDSRNAPYVLESLRSAVKHCQSNIIQAMVTGPVNKAVINDAGYPFSGHTEFLAKLANREKVVMLLASQEMRVALVTTHLPLSQVTAQITVENIRRSLQILDEDLRSHFGIKNPRIMVLGLNPHAGEEGHLGREEIDIIIPCLNTLRNEGIDLTGPVPADTAFTEKHLSECDAVLAMYHDQGLPVLKYSSFGKAVNITLGLPFIRTSVDHGTALTLAGTGSADAGSLAEAVNYAIKMAEKHEQ